MTLLGIVIEVRFTQFKKTPAPSVVILLEILIDFKLIHYMYLLLVDYQYYTL